MTDHQLFGRLGAGLDRFRAGSACARIPVVRGLASAAAGFLLAVLWFDLMFDVQSRGHRHAVVPEDARNSIAAYYRRVTTTARPMNRLVAAAMVVAIAALVGEIAQDRVQSWVAWTSLVLVVAAVALAASRTVRNAVRLGAQADEPQEQSKLARSILQDHVVCFGAVATTLVLQVAIA